MWLKFYRILSGIFIVCWVLFIFLEYWQKHPPYFYALSNFYYLDQIMNLTVMGVIFTWAAMGLKKLKKPLKIVNGLALFGIVLTIIMLSIGIYYIRVLDPTELNLIRFLTIAWSMILPSISTYLILWASHSFGSLFSERFFGKHFEPIDQMLVDLAVGIMLLVFVMFILGSFSLLHVWTMGPIMLLAIALNYKSSLGFLKKTLIEPISVNKEFSILGAFSFFMILVTISLNLAQNITPFPRGYDALTFYVNIPALVEDHSGLISGYSPYNWSLFMSLGLIVFKQIETVLVLSFVGGILSLMALYRLGRYWLNLDMNYLLLGSAIFYITPTVVHQSSREQKIDLGLLYVSLVIVLIFAYWLRKHFTDKKQAKLVAEQVKAVSDSSEETEITDTTNPIPPTNSKEPFLDPYIVLMGLLSGFAFGTKFTTLFLFFGIIAGIWYAYNGKWAYLAIAFLSLFGILLFRIDDMTELRQYHLSANILQWVLAATGVGLLVFTFMRKQEGTLKSIKLSIIYILFFAIPFVPWLGKNYMETKSFTVDALLNGDNRLGPKMSIPKMDKHYEVWKKRNP